MTFQVKESRKIRRWPDECWYTNLPDHLQELVLLIFLQGFVVLHRGDVQLMLGLGLRGLKRAGKDGNLCVFQNLGRDKGIIVTLTWIKLGYSYTPSKGFILCKIRFGTLPLHFSQVDKALHCSFWREVIRSDELSWFWPVDYLDHQDHHKSRMGCLSE